MKFFITALDTSGIVTLRRDYRACRDEKGNGTVIGRVPER